MRADSHAHTNLYRQEQQEASIQHGFHRFGGGLRRLRGCTIVQGAFLVFINLVFNLFPDKGSVMRCNYGSHTNFCGRRGCAPQTALTSFQAWRTYGPPYYTADTISD